MPAQTLTIRTSAILQLDHFKCDVPAFILARIESHTANWKRLPLHVCFVDGEGNPSAMTPRLMELEKVFREALRVE